MPKKTEDIPVPLSGAEVARYFELMQFEAERKALEIRFKGEIEDGDFPVEFEGETYQVKRWEQTSTFMEDVFLQRYSDEDFPEFFNDAPLVAEMVARFSVIKNPELYERKPDVGYIKEHLSADDKHELFKQAQYLKITKKAN